MKILDEPILLGFRAADMARIYKAGIGSKGEWFILISPYGRWKPKIIHPDMLVSLTSLLKQTKLGSIVWL